MNCIQYQVGDATAPEAEGNSIICHICNDIGGWGKGFVLAISKRWAEPEAAYRKWHQEGSESGFALGAVQLVQVEPSLWVANMVGQHGLRRAGGRPPIRYEAVLTCLQELGRHAEALPAHIHMPRIGCGLAGGKWGEIEPIIAETLCEKGIPVTVYDLSR